MTPGLDATAALAAALHDAYCKQNVPMHRDSHAHDTEAILAALAAAGWRITSAPESLSIPEEGADGDTSADDPVSAQAAPDPCSDCGPYAPCPRHDEPEYALHKPSVRAALEGLRAEVAYQQAGPRAWNGASELVIERAVTLAAIDARLADLP